MEMKRYFGAGAIALAVAVGAPASNAAQVIMFDPDGAGATFSPVAITTMDWRPGNALSLNGNINGTPVGNSVSLVTLAQAGLSNLLNGASIVTPAGIPELSFVASIPETATVVTPTTVTFSPSGSGTNFFEIYSGGAATNDLAGTGFNDGVLILKGTITTVGGAFTAGTPVQNLDNFVTDNYPGTDSVTGGGGSPVHVNVTPVFYDPNYFLTAPFGLTIDFNTSLVVPFDQADPSALFAALGNVGGLGTAGPAPARAPNLGPVNGLLTPSGNCTAPGQCDFQFQADANNSFTTVPEPGSLALLAITLMGAGFATRRGVRASAATGK